MDRRSLIRTVSRTESDNNFDSDTSAVLSNLPCITDNIIVHPKLTPATYGTLRCRGTKAKLISWRGTQTVHSVFMLVQISDLYLSTAYDMGFPVTLALIA